MAWNQKYWDIIKQLYWTPAYRGRKPIPKNQWIIDGDRLSVPLNLVDTKASLYTRDKNEEDLIAFLHKQEEILNHVFDITFAIAPGSVIAKLFHKRLGVKDLGPFESLGPETNERYGLPYHYNNTQVDGYFVSTQSAIGVELKLESASSAEQIAKYAALLAWEELRSGSKRNLGLLYIVSEKKVATHWEKCGLTGPDIGPHFIASAKEKVKGRVKDLYEDEPELLDSVFDRLKLAVITWREFREDVIAIQNALDLEHPGDQTLYRLLEGFVIHLDAHQRTGL